MVLYGDLSCSCRAILVNLKRDVAVLRLKLAIKRNCPCYVQIHIATDSNILIKQTGTFTGFLYQVATEYNLTVEYNISGIENDKMLQHVINTNVALDLNIPDCAGVEVECLAQTSKRKGESISTQRDTTRCSLVNISAAGSICRGIICSTGHSIGTAAGYIVNVEQFFE